MNVLINSMGRGSVSPLTAQFRTNLNNIGSSADYYYKKNANDYLLNVIAPGKSGQLRDSKFGKSHEKEIETSKKM